MTDRVKKAKRKNARNVQTKSIEILDKFELCTLWLILFQGK